ncbi:MAG: hypothetical protein IJB86_03140 [Clostridia bacterium]|nr:hypothetical protein [Clostridia bacterium]
MFKRILSALIATVLIFSCATAVSAISLDEGIQDLRAQFSHGEGPVVGKYSVDYRYFSPVKDGDSTKYPLVIWLHGLGDGGKEGAPLQKSDIAYWASDEFQSRFDAKGAFVMIARSREELGVCWSNDMIEPLYGAITELISIYKKNIDLSRIYIGGYSMGGKMTLKMAIAYPEMFAAAFPMCPAWSPSSELLENLKDMPVWILSSTRDPLVNYYFAVTPTWEKLIGVSNVPESCRFSTFNRVCFPNGKKTSSNHHVWFAVNYDLFTTENGAYYNMSTVNGKGEEVTLNYPDGMISWLTSHTSDFDGTAIEGTGNIKDGDQTDNMIALDGVREFFRHLINAIKSVFKNGI